MIIISGTPQTHIQTKTAKAELDKVARTTKPFIITKIILQFFTPNMTNRLSEKLETNESKVCELTTRLLGVDGKKVRLEVENENLVREVKRLGGGEGLLKDGWGRVNYEKKYTDAQETIGKCINLLNDNQGELEMSQVNTFLSILYNQR